jgi:hypothetical protein
VTVKYNPCGEANCCTATEGFSRFLWISGIIFRVQKKRTEFDCHDLAHHLIKSGLETERDRMIVSRTVTWVLCSEVQLFPLLSVSYPENLKSSAEELVMSKHWPFTRFPTGYRGIRRAGLS